MSVIDSEILEHLNHDDNQPFERGIEAFQTWRQQAADSDIGAGVIEVLSSISDNQNLRFSTRYSRARKIVDIARLPRTAIKDVAEACREWSVEVKNTVIAVLPHDMQHYAYASQPSTPGEEEEDRQPAIEKTSIREATSITEPSSVVGPADDSAPASDAGVYSIDEAAVVEESECESSGPVSDIEAIAEPESRTVSDDLPSFATIEPIRTNVDTPKSAPVAPMIGVANSESRDGAQSGSPPESNIRVKPKSDAHVAVPQGQRRHWWWWGAFAIAGVAAVAFFLPDNDDTKPRQSGSPQVSVVKDGTDVADEPPDTDSSPNNAQTGDPPETKFNAVDAIIVLGGKVRQDNGEQVLSVWLNDTSINDASLTHLKDLLSLQELWLGSTQIKGSGLVHLKRLQNLETIDLGGCDQLRDSGLEHLKKLPRIKEIYLWGCNKITDRGLVHLEGLSALQTLDLGQTKVTDAGVNRFKQALPNCEVMR